MVGVLNHSQHHDFTDLWPILIRIFRNEILSDNRGNGQAAAWDYFPFADKSELSNQNCGRNTLSTRVTRG